MTVIALEDLKRQHKHKKCIQFMTIKGNKFNIHNKLHYK